MDNQQATDSELGWLAGIIDGEGWLGMTITSDLRGGIRSNRRVKVIKVELKVTNCDEAIIMKAAEILRKLGVNPYLRVHKQLSYMRRPVHECATKHMTTVEKAITPLRELLTGNKRERAELILRFIELRRDNPGVPNPVYANEARGRLGPRTLRPYSAEELSLIEACRDLQSRGASETTRESRDRQVRGLKRSNAERQQSQSDKI